MKILFEVSVFAEGSSPYKKKIVESYISTLKRLELIERIDLLAQFPLDILDQFRREEGLRSYIGTDNVPEDEGYDLLILSDAFSSSDWLHLKNLSKIKAISGFVFNTTDYHKLNWEYKSGSLAAVLRLSLFYELLYHYDQIIVPLYQLKKDLHENWGIPQDKISVISTEPMLSNSTNIIPFKKREASVVMYSEDEFNLDNLNKIFDLFDYRKKNRILTRDPCLIIFSNSHEPQLQSKLKQELADGLRIVFLPLLSDAEKAQIIGSASAVLLGKSDEIKFLECSFVKTPFILFDTHTPEVLEADIPLVKSQKELRLMLDKLLLDGSYWEQILRKCLALCQKTQDLFNELNIEKKLSGILESAQTRMREEKIALFGCLPPYRSGVARYNLDWLSSSKRELCFFAGTDNFLKFTSYERDRGKLDVLSEGLYEFARRRYEIKGKIFILGNSRHNLAPLFASIDFGDKESWFYLHEAYLNDLLIDYSKSVSVSFHEVYRFFYKKDTNGVGIKILLSLTPISKFIVNNERCKELILREAKNFREVKVCKAFLPLPFLPNVSSRRKEYRESFLVGTFGIPTDLKLTHVIVDAVSTLFELGYSIKLIVAGYKADSYFADKEIPNFIEVLDSPSYLELLTMEKTVDLAIQLRRSCNGESSGVVSELLSLGTPTITVQDLAGEKKSTYLRIVPELISSKGLAEIIIEKYLDVQEKDKIFNNGSEANSLIDKFSMKNLTNKILKIINSNKGKK